MIIVCIEELTCLEGSWILQMKKKYQDSTTNNSIAGAQENWRWKWQRRVGVRVKKRAMKRTCNERGKVDESYE